jgi:HEPN domain-containing protein
MAEERLIREWLEKAEEDFEFALSVIDQSSFYAQICFHFHQAAEKYLKTLIIALELEFRKIHDLPVLLQSCLGKKPELESLIEGCRFLNAFYIDTRYPVHWPTRYTKEEAFKAKTATTNIRDAVKKALKSI